MSLTARDTTGSLGIPRAVRPYDPFLYTHSGKKDYPKTFTAHLPDISALRLIAHIWPPDAADPGFRLGRRRPTAFQGFYFFRNDRLIQAGGWNGLVKEGVDQELILARVSVDLPSHVELNVQKSVLQISEAFVEAIEKAHCNGAALRNYLEDARRIYRHRQRTLQQHGNIPLVPGPGLPMGIQRSIRALIRDEIVDEIEFVWAPLSKRSVFELDPDDHRVILNQKYRRRLLGDQRASSADIPMIKTLIFLLLREEFNRERFSAKRRAWLNECNAVLLAATKQL